MHVFMEFSPDSFFLGEISLNNKRVICFIFITYYIPADNRVQTHGSLRQ